MPDLNIYPNPVSDVLHVDAGSDIHEISIQNVLGQEIKRFGFIRSNTAELNISELNKGIYFLRVSCDNGATAVRSFIKR